MTTAVEPREHTIEARGLTFHYVEWGAPDAPPIVLLHGMSAMCRIWDHLARVLQDRYRLIALDQRGHGDTSWPTEPAYSTDDYVGDLEMLVDAWGLERFDLIGLSMGGMNSIAYSAKHAERVKHLVVVDIRPALNHEKRPSYQLDQHIADHGHQKLASLDEAFRVRKATHPHTPDASISHHVQHLMKATDNGRVTNKHDPRVSYYWRPRNLWSELEKVTSPVFIIRGGKSEVLPPETAEEMFNAFPNARLLTIEEAGHTVPEDAPERFNELVESFLAT